MAEEIGTKGHQRVVEVRQKGRKILKEKEKIRLENNEKTLKLKALRLAKEAAETEAKKSG